MNEMDGFLGSLRWHLASPFCSLRSGACGRLESLELRCCFHLYRIFGRPTDRRLFLFARAVDLIRRVGGWKWTRFCSARLGDFFLETVTDSRLFFFLIYPLNSTSFSIFPFECRFL